MDLATYYADDPEYVRLAEAAIVAQAAAVQAATLAQLARHRGDLALFLERDTEHTAKQAIARMADDAANGRAIAVLRLIAGATRERR